MEINKKSIFFVSLPKSGTVYTWTAICDVTSFQMPEFHKLEGWELYSLGRDFSCPKLYACGDYNTQLLRPDEMKHYAEGYFFGAHMQASFHNITVLEESGIKKVVVLLRDPRDAFISWVHHIRQLGPSARDYHSKIYHIPRDYYNWTLEKQFHFQIRSFFPIVVNWIEGWLDYYASANRKTDILFVFYDELKRRPLEYLAKIVEFNNIVNADYSKIPEVKKGELHFRKGEHSQWEFEFSQEDQLLVNNLMQDRIIQAFELASQKHPDIIKAQSYFNMGHYVAAANSALSAIIQFSNSRYCYNLFFQALKSAGIENESLKNKINTQLESITTEDYFIYRDQIVLDCKYFMENLKTSQHHPKMHNQYIQAEDITKISAS